MSDARDAPKTPGKLKSLVFVAMPFGLKPDPRQPYKIDFDRIYEKGIKPALDPFNVEIDYIRADEEQGGGVIHLPMFERLLLAEIAIVDVTSENANVFYELGIRHAAKPHTTIIISGSDGGLSFDINMMRAVTYKLDKGVISDAAAADLAEAIGKRLTSALLSPHPQDSPLFQLIPGYRGVSLERGSTTSFREREHVLDDFRQRLNDARKKKAAGLDDVIAVEADLADINDANQELVMDVVLSYRDIGTPAALARLIALVERMPVDLRDRSVAVRQQYALALNRRNIDTDRHRAIEVLEALCNQNGETPETCGILGRVYKDNYNDARIAQRKAQATGSLLMAIGYYRRGFDADPRDFYPGINLATLLAMEGSDKSLEELKRVAPAVAFAVARHDAIDQNNYWTIATLLEIAVLGNDWHVANEALARMLALPTLKAFDLQSTTRQLALLRSYELRELDLGEFDALLVEMLGALPAEMAAEPLKLLPPATLAAFAKTLGDGERAALQTTLDPALFTKL